MKYVYIYGGAIGDSLVGVHLGRVLAQSIPGSTLMLVATRRNAFVRELVQALPGIAYHEVVRNNPLTWAPLIQLAIRRSAIAVLEPSDVPLPFWWRCIVRVSQFKKGGTEVHGQIIGHERSVSKNVQIVTISSQDNLFTTIVPRIVSAWGAPATAVTPALPRRTGTAAPARPYLLFHFFAGSYRRSFPIEKAHPLLVRARTLFPTYEFVLTATPSERARAESMAQGVADTRVESEVSAHQMLSLLQGASLVVGVASGITHIAAHLADVPLIVLANLSDPYWLPSYSATTTILANREECQCKGNKEGACAYQTAEGEVFRCLYFIADETILESMQRSLKN